MLPQRQMFEIWPFLITLGPPSVSEHGFSTVLGRLRVRKSKLKFLPPPPRRRSTWLFWHAAEMIQKVSATPHAPRFLEVAGHTSRRLRPVKKMYVLTSIIDGPLCLGGTLPPLPDSVWALLENCAPRAPPPVQQFSVPHRRRLRQTRPCDSANRAPGNSEGY